MKNYYFVVERYSDTECTIFTTKEDLISYLKDSKNYLKYDLKHDLLSIYRVTEDVTDDFLKEVGFYE